MLKKGIFDNLYSDEIDNIVNGLSLDEKIAQLLIVEVNSDKDIIHEDKVADIIEQYKVGGLIFLTGNVENQVKLTNRYQSISKIPLLVALDAEWGLAMRLKETMKFPFQQALGAMPTHEGIYEMGAEIARQLKRIGVHINFAPCVDVNTNPENPVISYRAFGENTDDVIKKSYAYYKGMVDNGVFAVIKHFPGHGDADKDSHFELPHILLDKNRLYETELRPFRELIDKGVEGVMVGHLHVPALDNTPKLPSSLSKPIITNLLKEEMGFEGIVISDALDMKGVTDGFPPGVSEAMAITAGNDMLEMCRDVKLAIESIKKAVSDGQISEKEIENKCRKVIALKKWTKALDFKPIEINSIDEDLNRSEAKELNLNLKRQAVTIIKNKNGIIPVKQAKIALLTIGQKEETLMQKELAKSLSFDNFNILHNISEKEQKLLTDKLEKYDLIIAGLHNLSVLQTKNFGVSGELAQFVKQLVNKFKVITVVFGNAYTLNVLPEIKLSDGVLLTYSGLRPDDDEEDLNYHIACAEILSGKQIIN